MAKKKKTTVLTLIPSFSNLSLLPGDEAAVMDNAVLHIDSSLFMCVYRPVVLAPAQSNGGVQVGGGALQRESVTPEYELPLRRDQLKQRKLQRRVCNTGQSVICVVLH